MYHWYIFSDYSPDTRQSKVPKRKLRPMALRARACTGRLQKRCMCLEPRPFFYLIDLYVFLRMRSMYRTKQD